ncbi:MAG: hypothetical protein FD138_2979 [Planctomycetota bacterium]|nr:MAG: hypothetical protein FD138_2979 [Planctomycetota bacterium]
MLSQNPKLFAAPRLHASPLPSFADQIEARLRQAQAHVDRLTQSLLRKAFRGELVPTEHTLAVQTRP